MLRQGGRHLHQPPDAVKRKCRHKFGTPRSGGRDRYYSRGPSGVKPARLDLRDRRALSRPGPGVRKSPRDSRNLSCVALGYRPRDRPGTRTLSGSHSVRGGRLVAPSGGVCQHPSDKKIGRPPRSGGPGRQIGAGEAAGRGDPLGPGVGTPRAPGPRRARACAPARAGASSSPKTIRSTRCSSPG